MPRRLTKKQIRAKHRLTGNHQTCKPSTVIAHLEDLPCDDLLAVPYMRVSRCEQRKSGNLKRRMRWLRRKLRDQGIAWRDCFREVVSGTSLQNRSQLVAAIKAARQMQDEDETLRVVVVTDTRNRFVRGKHYNGQASSDPPTESQQRELAALADGVTLATVRRPDAPFGEVRSHELAVAKQGGVHVGRPKKQMKQKSKPGSMKKRRAELLPRARRLRMRGRSLREIGRRLDVPFRTVGGWLQNDKD